ncbi:MULTISPECIES: hypothetical protein [Streptomyces]|uniref:Helix-turn-helix transcriptional regulator n=1 Tax=Streptomyces flavotricini TaxID=66888 RepID=A0ABS8E2I8_9ACTN|nr:MULTISPECIES: hypothetical protein [Streptomyces]MCC0094884.1 hypothetical protein [Streptomyces flavotricini]WSI27414.1 hypothetical protein OG311_30830 [Streptomyces sp. NBC_01343]
MPMRDSGRAGTLPATSDELSRLLTAVRRGRVLTVTGRFREPRSLLVREIAERLSSNFYDGTAVVTPGRPFGLRELTAALGCVPGMPFLPYGTTDAVSWLAERDMLLVLDGAEHLEPDALAWLRRLLTAAPGLRILAAGRSPLAFPGERVHRL